MKKAEAKDLVIKYIASFFEKEGFALRKRKDTVVEYIRSGNWGFDGFAGSPVDYNPSQIIRYSLYKRHESVENIMAGVDRKLKLNPPIDRNTVTIAFSYTTLNSINKDTYLPKMETEIDVKNCVDIIISFLRETAFPLLDRFNDLREIDREINGQFFWDTDWRKPFNLGGNFDVKRLVVARLANNEDFEEVVDKTYKSIEKLSLENGYPFVYDRSDLSMPLPYVVSMLKDVSPLYETDTLNSFDPKVFDWVSTVKKIKEILKANNYLMELVELEQAQVVFGTPGEVFMSTLDVLSKMQKSNHPCVDGIKNEIDALTEYSRYLGYL